jgi:hypothetical protein
MRRDQQHIIAGSASQIWLSLFRHADNFWRKAGGAIWYAWLKVRSASQRPTTAR